jgi:hypothetical protein
VGEKKEVSMETASIDIKSAFTQDVLNLVVRHLGKLEKDWLT